MPSRSHLRFPLSSPLRRDPLTHALRWLGIIALLCITLAALLGIYRLLQPADGDAARIKQRLISVAEHTGYDSAAALLTHLERISNMPQAQNPESGEQPNITATPSTPPQPPTPQPVASTQDRHVDVQAGDTLSALSQRAYGTTTKVDLILKANPELDNDPHKLKPGMRLRVPQVDTDANQRSTAPSGTTAPEVPQPPQAAANEEAKYLDVKAGDTLFALSQRAYGTSTKTDLILRANPILENDPRKLKPGMRLNIPALDADAKPAPAASPAAPENAQPDAQQTHAATPAAADTQEQNGTPMNYVTVRPGDTLSELSRRAYGTSTKIDVILYANPELNNDPLKIKPGMRLRAPIALSATTSPTTILNNEAADASPTTPDTPQAQAPATTDTPSTPAAVSEQSDNVRFIEVQSGDTLSEVSQRAYGTATKSDVILGANPELENDPRKLKPGMRLRIPKLAPTTDSDNNVAETSTSSAAASPSTPKFLEVQAGDTLSELSQRAYGTATKVDLILQANPELKDPLKLKPGMQLSIPPLP